MDNSFFEKSILYLTNEMTKEEREDFELIITTNTDKKEDFLETKKIFLISNEIERETSKLTIDVSDQILSSASYYSILADLFSLRNLSFAGVYLLLAFLIPFFEIGSNASLIGSQDYSLLISSENLNYKSIQSSFDKKDRLSQISSDAYRGAILDKDLEELTQLSRSLFVQRLKLRREINELNDKRKEAIGKSNIVYSNYLQLDNYEDFWVRDSVFQINPNSKELQVKYLLNNGIWVSGDAPSLNNDDPISAKIDLLYNKLLEVENSLNEIQVIENRFIRNTNNYRASFPFNLQDSTYELLKKSITKLSHIPKRKYIKTAELINHFNYSFPEPEPGNIFEIFSEGSISPWNLNNFVVGLGIRGERGKMVLEQVPQIKLIYDNDYRVDYEIMNRVYSQLFSSLSRFINGSSSIHVETPDFNYYSQLNDVDRSVFFKDYICTKLEEDKDRSRFIILTDKELDFKNKCKGGRHSKVDIILVGQGSFIPERNHINNITYYKLNEYLDVYNYLTYSLFDLTDKLLSDANISVKFNSKVFDKVRKIGFNTRVFDERDVSSTPYSVLDSSLALVFDTKLKIPLEKLVNNSQFYHDALITINISYFLGSEKKQFVKKIQLSDLIKTTPSSTFSLMKAVSEYSMLITNSKYKGTASYHRVLGVINNLRKIYPNHELDEFYQIVSLSKAS